MDFCDKQKRVHFRTHSIWDPLGLREDEKYDDEDDSLIFGGNRRFFLPKATKQVKAHNLLFAAVGLFTQGDPEKGVKPAEETMGNTCMRRKCLPSLPGITKQRVLWDLKCFTNIFESLRPLLYREVCSHLNWKSSGWLWCRSSGCVHTLRNWLVTPSNHLRYWKSKRKSTCARPLCQTCKCTVGDQNHERGLS